MKKTLILILLLIVPILTSCSEDVETVSDYTYFDSEFVTEKEYKKYVSSIRDNVFIGKITLISDPVSHNKSDEKSSYKEDLFTYITFEIIHSMKGSYDEKSVTFTVIGGFTEWGDFYTRYGKLNDVPKVGDYVLLSSIVYSPYSTPTDRRFVEGYPLITISKYEYILLKDYDMEKDYTMQNNDINDSIKDMQEVLREETIQD